MGWCRLTRSAPENRSFDTRKYRWAFRWRCDFAHKGLDIPSRMIIHRIGMGPFCGREAMRRKLVCHARAGHLHLSAIGQINNRIGLQIRLFLRAIDANGPISKMNIQVNLQLRDSFDIMEEGNDKTHD